MSDVMEKIFGSPGKVKILKLFLFNPESSFDVNETAKRAGVTQGLARREIGSLEKIGFLRKKSYSKAINIQKNRMMVPSHRKTDGWGLNIKFKHLEALYNFVTDVGIFSPEDLISKLSKAIKIDLLLIAGFFIKNPDSRVDLLIVGENPKEDALEGIIRQIEADLGREMKYAVFNTTEFRYRQSVFDRFIRDILDYPHQKLVNKLGI